MLTRAGATAALQSRQLVPPPASIIHSITESHLRYTSEAASKFTRAVELLVCYDPAQVLMAPVHGGTLCEPKAVSEVSAVAGAAFSVVVRICKASSKDLTAVMFHAAV